jgi:D-arabinitol 2-dehydrogenase
MAEGLAEAGGNVHCLDRAVQPDPAFTHAQTRVKEDGIGQLTYHQMDVTQNDDLEKCIADIADEKQRLDGLVAGASRSGFLRFAC